MFIGVDTTIKEDKMEKAIIAGVLIFILGGCSTIDKAKINLRNEVKSWDTIAIEKEGLKIFKIKADGNIYYQVTGEEPKILTEEELVDYLLETATK